MKTFLRALGNIAVTGRPPMDSPAQYVATQTSPTCATGVAALGIHVDNMLQYSVHQASLNTTVALNPGR